MGTNSRSPCILNQRFPTRIPPTASSHERVVMRCSTSASPQDNHIERRSDQTEEATPAKGDMIGGRAYSNPRIILAAVSAVRIPIATGLLAKTQPARVKYSTSIRS
jgi:hypothetical protein